MFKQLYKWKWIIAALSCFLLLYILPTEFIEKYYSTGFFLWIRKIVDNTFAHLPFPSYYLFIVVLFFIILKWFLHFFKEKPSPLLQHLFKIASFAGFMITLFFIMWGFNYGRIPIEKHLNFEINTLTEEQLIVETKETIAHLSQIRKSIKNDTNVIPEIVFVNNIEENSRDALCATLNDFKYPNSTKIRGRFVLDDMFLIFGVGGQYMPYIGEGNVDDAVYYSRKSFYLMHEMAHGNGFTNEATCNFLAYVSCMQAGNLSIEYSGEINYLIYLFNAWKNTNENIFLAFKNELPLALKKDLEDMKRHNEKHTFKSAFLGDMINNAYLKILGIQDGVKNYDKMVLLVYAWKQQKINIH
ncbi:MAG: hypothetical protein RJA25_1807 [Bacteroidota bacterium]|jgi:hypothetical protein